MSRRRRVFVLDAERADGLTEAVREIEGVSGFHVRQHHHELFPAVARHEVACALQRVANGSGNRGEAVVTLLVSVGVVELLEAVDVDHHERERTVPSPASPPLAIEHLVERPPVRDPGENVGGRKAFELEIRLFELLRDLEEHRVHRRELLVASLETSLQARDPELMLDAREHFFELKWLRDVIGPARLEGANLVERFA